MLIIIPFLKPALQKVCSSFTCDLSGSKKTILASLLFADEMTGSPQLHQTLIKHGMNHFDKSGNIGTCHIIAGDSIFVGSLKAAPVN